MYVKKLSCANYSKKITPDQSDWPGERKLLGGERLHEVLDSASHEVGLVHVRTDVRLGNLDAFGPVERNDHGKAITNRTNLKSDAIVALQGFTNGGADLGAEELSRNGGDRIFGDVALEVRDHMFYEIRTLADVEAGFAYTEPTHLLSLDEAQETRMCFADQKPNRVGIPLRQSLTDSSLDFGAGLSSHHGTLHKNLEPAPRFTQKQNLL